MLGNAVQISTGLGAFVVRDDARGATIRLLIASPRMSYAAVIDLARASLRMHEANDGCVSSLHGPWSRKWSMSAPRPGNGFTFDPFVYASQFVDYACADLGDEEPATVLGRIRCEARRAILAASLAALARCDPATLRLARRLHPEARFFAYRWMALDPTGSVRQLVDSCPGLLLFCAGQEGLAGSRAALDAAFAGVVRGVPLAAIIRPAIEALLEARLARDPDLENAIAAVGRERYIQQACRLVRRAGPATHPRSIIAPAAVAFPPEDIPRRHVDNARWYAVMASVASRVAGAPLDVVPAISSFASRHYKAMAGAGRRLGAAARVGPWPGADGTGEIARRLVIHAVETGSRPRRCSNVIRHLAAVRRWMHRERGGGSPAYRVGRLVERLSALELGTVAGIEFLCDAVEWDETDGQLALPDWRWSAVSIPDLQVRHLADAAALAREAREMDHCAASLLAEVASGELVVFAVRARGSRLTVALEPRGDGTYEMAELRGVSDRMPTVHEACRVREWVAAVNREASRNG